MGTIEGIRIGTWSPGTGGKEERRDVPARPRERRGEWGEGHSQRILTPRSILLGSPSPRPGCPDPPQASLFALPVQLPQPRLTPTPPPARRGHSRVQEAEGGSVGERA